MEGSWLAPLKSRPLVAIGWGRDEPRPRGGLAMDSDMVRPEIGEKTKTMSMSSTGLTIPVWPEW
jgi:hypothetical protein